VDFTPSPKAADYTARMREFLDECVLPAGPVYHALRAARRGTPAERELPPGVEELKAEARGRGLWSLFTGRLGTVHIGLRAGGRGLPLVTGDRPGGDQIALSRLEVE
jgi:hypothetical protein